MQQKLPVQKQIKKPNRSGNNPDVTDSREGMPSSGEAASFVSRSLATFLTESDLAERLRPLQIPPRSSNLSEPPPGRSNLKPPTDLGTGTEMETERADADARCEEGAAIAASHHAANAEPVGSRRRTRRSSGSEWERSEDPDLPPISYLPSRNLFSSSRSRAL